MDHRKTEIKETLWAMSVIRTSDGLEAFGSSEERWWKFFLFCSVVGAEDCEAAGVMFLLETSCGVVGISPGHVTSKAGFWPSHGFGQLPVISYSLPQ